MRLVVDQQRAVLACEPADGLQVAGLGEHDADVGQRRLHQHGGDVVVGELVSQLVGLVELGDAGGLGEIDRPADVAGPRDDLALLVAERERLVDAAVVAPGVDEDLRALRHLAGEPDRPAVGVGRRERERPLRRAEAAGELGADPGGVLGRHHRGDAVSAASCDRLDGRGRRVAGHRAGVAEREVDVGVAVEVGHAGVLRVVEIEREAARGEVHPGHGDAAEQVWLGVCVGGL